MDNMLTCAQVAKRLGVTTRTLHNWRADGIGPDYVRLTASAVRYPMAALEAFIEARTVKAGA